MKENKVMKLEDYHEYYIQGSDHYLIPKAAFIELYEETNNFRKESRENKEVIDKAKELINKCVEEQLKYDYLMDRINLANYNMKLLDILNEVE